MRALKNGLLTFLEERGATTLPEEVVGGAR